MLQQGIKITALSVEDDEVQFQIELTNGASAACLDFYGYKDEFENFSKGLLAFPQTINDIVKYELGEVGGKWAYYILLKVFCYENNGYSAIHVKIDNNGKQPYTNKNEFYITTVPASLNKLGQLLQTWNLDENKEIIWIAE